MSLVRRLFAAALHRRAAERWRDTVAALPAHDDERPAAAGWHESSHELRRGLEVIELDCAAA